MAGIIARIARARPCPGGGRLQGKDLTVGATRTLDVARAAVLVGHVCHASCAGNVRHARGVPSSPRDQDVGRRIEPGNSPIRCRRSHVRVGRRGKSRASGHSGSGGWAYCRRRCRECGLAFPSSVFSCNPLVFVEEKGRITIG